MNQHKIFYSFPLTQKSSVDLSDNEFPCALHSFNLGNNVLTATNQAATTYGFIYKGVATLRFNNFRYPLCEGMYFSVPGTFEIQGGSGLLIEYQNYHGFFNIGGPIEEQGRLKYINGCMDSLIIPPIKLGDPCMNILYFPPSIKQTTHTHPSYRLGLIIEGKGKCLTDDGAFDLIPGMAFVLRENGAHAFETLDRTGMKVLTFHPDSDFGPEDDNHPMINRTVVDGVSANKIPQILTE